jgi:hypothetical protein
MSTGRSQPQHTAYILQPPANSSRNRMRDRKNQSALRLGHKSTSASNTMLDEQTQPSYQPTLSSSSSSAHMRSLDRRHVRGAPHNSSINSTTSKATLKSSHTDIYGSLERNKHSKVSQPTLHGITLNDENDRSSKPENQAHDFYHLTSTVPNTSTIINVGNVLQQQGSFDQTDSIAPPLPSSTHRSRRPPPPPSVFQPHFDSSTSTTPKDTYYTISGSKDVSTHPHNHHARSILVDSFYNGSNTSKQSTTVAQQQQKPMHRYDTSPLLVRRLDHTYTSQPHTQVQQQQQHQSRYPVPSYNRAQSSSMMTMSQPPLERSNAHITTTQSSALLFRPHSSQSSSSQSSG